MAVSFAERVDLINHHRRVIKQWKEAREGFPLTAPPPSMSEPELYARAGLHVARTQPEKMPDASLADLYPATHRVISKMRDCLGTDPLMSFPMPKNTR